MLFPLLVFLSTVCVIAGLYVWFTPSRAAQRLQTLNGAAPGTWTTTAVRLAAPIARLSLPEGEWENSPLRIRFLNAGIRRSEARILYFASKTLLPLLFGGLAYLIGTALAPAADSLTMALYAVSGALIGCYLPNFALHYAVKHRRREIFENFPDATDLMLVCVEAGLGLDAATVKVAEEMRHKSLPVAEELHLTNLEVRAGASRDQALRNLATRTGVEEVSTFSTMMAQADKFGTSIADSLRVFSDDLRQKRRARAEELAAKIPTKMLFPLVICVFPAIMMVILGPAIIQIVRIVLPSIAGGN